MTSVIEGLNEALLAKPAQAKVLKTNKLRADTTFVRVSVAYPTDSGLMAKAIKPLQANSLATRTKCRDRTKVMRKRARSIGANLRRRTNEAKDEFKAINAKMAALASKAVDEASRVAANARRALSQLGKAAPAKLERIARDLEDTASRVERIAEQTRQRLSGITPDGATRLVSLHNPDAHPIRKGRLGKPVEGGYRAQVLDNEDGVVVDHNVEMGIPQPMLAPAIKRVAARTGKVPRAVTADRGSGDPVVRETLGDMGDKTVVLPTRGKPTVAPDH